MDNKLLIRGMKISSQNKYSCRYILSFVVLSLLLLSCEKTIDMELDETGGKIVLYAFIQPDSALSISLSKSVSTLSTADYELVQNAKIQILRNHDFLQEVDFTNDTIWQTWKGLSYGVGDTIVLRVLQDNEDKVYAITYLPNVVKIDKSDTVRISKVDTDGILKRIMNVGIRFTDDLKTSDYYQLKLFAKTTTVNGLVETTKITPIVFPKTDKVFYDDQQGTSTIGNIDFDGLFNDTRINGRSDLIQFALPLSYFDVDASIVHQEIIVRLYHLTPDYYSYLRSRLTADSNSGIPIFDPIKIPSNVVGGYGLVSGLTLFADTIRVR